MCSQPSSMKPDNGYGGFLKERAARQIRRQVRKSNMKNIFVVSAGTMGLDIAQVFAAAGFSVTVRDITSDIIEKAQNRLTTTLNKRVEAAR